MTGPIHGRRSPIATASRKSSSSKDKNAVTLTSAMIKSQTEVFLASGKNKIEKIPNGVSGIQNHSGPKHIRLNNKNSR